MKKENILYDWADWIEFDDSTNVSKKEVDKIMSELKKIDKDSYALLFKLFHEVDRQIEGFIDDIKEMTNNY